MDLASRGFSVAITDWRGQGASDRLTRDPQGWRTMLAIFESVDDATNSISEIIGAGIVPAAR